MVIVKTIAELKQALGKVRLQGKSVGLVPTMGALHRGHISLVTVVREKADFVAVSIFVNPRQFGPQEDYSRYPRNLEQDLELLEKAGTDLVFTPGVDEFYPQEFATTVEVAGPALGLCGEFRSGHFAGVATIVVKLLNLFQPNLAVFGQKDLQQCAVIKRVVTDLNLDVEIVLGATVREEDGLAMSSRNAYLNAEERATATAIYRALSAAGKVFNEGERLVEHLLAVAKSVLDEQPGLQLQYLEAVNPETMTQLEGRTKHLALAIAAYVGKTRLIDNIILDAKELPKPR